MFGGTKKTNTPKTEFSKKLVAWAIIMTVACLITSYALSLMDHDPCSDITITAIGAFIAIAVAYEAKSYGEKNSRNKYGFQEMWERAKTQNGVCGCRDTNDNDIECADDDESYNDTEALG